MQQKIYNATIYETLERTKLIMLKMRQVNETLICLVKLVKMQLLPRVLSLWNRKTYVKDTLSSRELRTNVCIALSLFWWNFLRCNLTALESLFCNMNHLVSENKPIKFASNFFLQSEYEEIRNKEILYFQLF